MAIAKPKPANRRVIPAIKVHQWLPEWDRIKFDAEGWQRKPEKRHFYIFSIKAAELKALTGIQRRSANADQPRKRELGIQRRHEEERSLAIRDFVRYGYPACDLNVAQRKEEKYRPLLRPGWLPSAIIVNIRPENDEFGHIFQEDLVTVIDLPDGAASIQLPYGFKDSRWRPESSDQFPIQVIDGQHRLWAFNDVGIDEKGQFEVPVVAFDNLDIGFQAYLFWSINIRPKRIKPSLAFDLYPLLRSQDWLDGFSGHSIYRQTRAQEIVENLWMYPESPWYKSIDMLGEKTGYVTQSAWINSLTSSYIKRWNDKVDEDETRIGGLFGAPNKKDALLIGWNRAQQVAFLIYLGNELKFRVAKNSDWADKIRDSSEKKKPDPAFYSQDSLLNSDQGVRGLLAVTNDIFCALSRKYKLKEWQSASDDISDITDEAIKIELASIEDQDFKKIIKNMANILSQFDWRTYSAVPDDDKAKERKAAYRGGSGYKELKRHLLEHLSGESSDIGEIARALLRNPRKISHE